MAINEKGWPSPDTAVDKEQDARMDAALDQTLGVTDESTEPEAPFWEISSVREAHADDEPGDVPQADVGDGDPEASDTLPGASEDSGALEEGVEVAAETRDDEQREGDASSAQDERELEDALRVLSYDNVPSDVLDGLSREQTLDWAERRKKVQRDFADAHRELGELKKTLEGETAPGESEDSEAGEPIAATRTLPKEALELLKKNFDDESVSALTATFEAQLAVEREAYKADIQALAALVKPAVEGVTRQRLEGRYPELSNDDTFREVTQKAVALHKGGGYENEDDAWADAVRLVVRTGEPAERPRNPNQNRDRGQLTSRTSRQAQRNVITTPEEKADAVLDLVLDGNAREEVKRRMY